MTKEELVNEAEKSLDKRLGTYAYIRKQDCYTNYVDGYIDSAEPREKRIADLEKENAELKKNYEDSLVACGVLKAKVDTLAQPSLIESMQDALITTQKVAYEKQNEQLTKAKVALRNVIDYLGQFCSDYPDCVIEAELFLKDSEVEK
jgi:hypothetical protein